MSAMLDQRHCRVVISAWVNDWLTSSSAGRMWNVAGILQTGISLNTDCGTVVRGRST